MGEGYVEIAVIATAETAEALADFLFSEGAFGLVTEDPPEGSSDILLRASFPETSPIKPIVARLKEYQRALADLRLSGTDGRIEVRQVPATDWGQAWKEHFKPLMVGRRLIITPPWEVGPFPENQLILRIDPGMSFGTGHHATTLMCLEAVEAFMDVWGGSGGPRVLDVGTGTGILAVAAALLGAQRVVALDTDPEACEAVKTNLTLNKAAGCVELLHGSIDVLGPQMRFDLVLANLDAKTLFPLFDTLRILLVPGGRLVISGILVEDEGKVGAAASASGFRLLAHQSDGEWICLTLALERQGCLL
ncbi:MAG: 50S ribosomal protein L11 methyltransferase [Candidatus Methylomirabilales bacterium]